MSELVTRQEKVVGRHKARRVAWDLLQYKYANVEKLACPEKWELLEYLPQARQHILTGGDVPWPLVDPGHVADRDHACDVFDRLTEQFNRRDHQDARSRCWRFISSEHDRLRVKRRFGVWTFKEAYETGVEAARRFYVDVGVDWPGVEDLEDWSTLDGEARFA